MTHSITTDTRGTSTVVATALLIFIIIVTATAAGAYVTDQFREETSDTTEITESKIDTPTHDQVHISPLVGDDLALDTVEVRIEFLDRDAPPAVVTNLQAATDHSTSTQVTTTRTVDTAGEYEPVTKTVTSYEPTGETTTEATLPVYNWSKDVEVKRHVYEWRVWNDGDSLAEQQNQTVASATKPEGWDNVRKVGKMKVFKVSKERSHAPGTYKSRECVENKWRDCHYPRVTGVKSWHTTTVTETLYTEAPVQPADGWEKVYQWEKPVETKQISKYQYRNHYGYDYPDDHWFERDEDDFNTFLDDEGEPLYNRSAYNVRYEPVTTTATVKSSTKPGAGWERVGPVKVREQTYELDEPQPVYDTHTEEVVVGYDVSNTTQEVEQTRTVHVAEPAAVDSGNVTDGLASVDPDAAYLDIDGANSAAGVGGSLGSTHTGTLTQGETVVIQLDQQLLFEGERINVEIIDKHTNSRVLHRNVRVQQPETFQFAPQDGTTVASESAPASPDVNVDVPADAPDAPDTNLGDLPSVDTPDVDISDGDSPDASDGTSDTGSDDAADTGSDNGSDIVVLPQHDSDGGYVVEDRMGGGDIEGERKDETGGWHREPAKGGGAVTIVSPNYEGDLPPGPKGPTVSPTDDVPIPDGSTANIDYSSDPSSDTGAEFASRISGSPRLTGLTGGGGTSGSSGGGGGSGGSSGGGSYDGGSSFTRGGVGVV